MELSALVPSLKLMTLLKGYPFIGSLEVIVAIDPQSVFRESINGRLNFEMPCTF